MTRRDVAAFINAAASDRQLQAEWNGAETPEALAKVAERHGYAVEAVELEAALAELRERRHGELSDDDMEQVTGGTLTQQTVSKTTSPKLVTTTTTTPVPAKLELFEAWPSKWKG